jgi:hypothetical protein
MNLARFPHQGRNMKNPKDLLRQKEQEILRIKQEISALKLAAPLLEEDQESAEKKADWRRLVEMP